MLGVSNLKQIQFIQTKQIINRMLFWNRKRTYNYCLSLKITKKKKKRV